MTGSAVVINDSADPANPDAYLARLPIGERPAVPTDGAPFWDIFPYEGELTVRVLQSPVLPEPPRHGEDGPESCGQCARPDSDFLWTDEHWRLSGADAPSGLPATVLLQPRAHHDLLDLPAELSTRLGPMLQRVERAVLSLGGIGRVHVNRWGDGGAHLHLWLIARPEGLTQLRGSTLPLWMDVLPPLPAGVWAERARRIAAAMAARGGTAPAHRATCGR
ncbi:HIT family protein [Kitasatospora sp. NPDC056076]|uniref:HIT family protein n=1 Tax=Kitasatospora sp. NPDC056076 TaxID=3345703 RepID=UPI0035E3247C